MGKIALTSAEKAESYLRCIPQNFKEEAVNFILQIIPKGYQVRQGNRCRCSQSYSYASSVFSEYRQGVGNRRLKPKPREQLLVTTCCKWNFRQFTFYENHHVIFIKSSNRKNMEVLKGILRNESNHNPAQLANVTS